MEVVKMLSKLRIADFRYKCNALLKLFIIIIQC